MRHSDGKNIRTAWLLILLFTAVCLVPNVVLAVTEPYRATTVVASLLIPVGLALLWCMISPNPARMILWGIPIMVLCAFQLVISYLFGNSIIAVDMFTNLVTTNASEAGELLSGIYPAVVIVCVLYIPVIVWAVISTGKNRKEKLKEQQGLESRSIRYTLTHRERKRGVAAGIVLVVAGTVFALASFRANRNFALNKHIFPFNVVHNMGLSVERWWMAKNYPSNIEDFSFDVKRDRTSGKREIYVLVIGEASRAHSWSLYGYGRQTTPRLDTTSGLIPMADVFTQSNTTHKSVPIILSAAAAHSYDRIYHVKGLPALFSEAGFYTAFITNQPANRSLTDHLTAQSDTVIYATPRTRKAVQQFDGEVLPHLQNILGSTDSNLLVIIHTYGSHAQHYKRYPREFAKFSPDETTKISPGNREALLNAYDNSIYYTDYVLSEIIGLLQRTDVVSAMLYISDHGEDVMDDSRNRFLHASPSTTYYQLHVPAFIWLSEDYNIHFPDIADIIEDNSIKAASTGEVFHTMAGLAFLESENYIDRSFAWTCPTFLPSDRLYVTDDDIAVDIMRSGLGEEDIRLMESKGLRFDPERYGVERF
ncbi:MAG: lipid A phosphoethanolamine transferase [Rikenellaceae bacterium]|nr:lipid A phosphoethanolamine transferase [Rikenellaceae bacterium]